MKAVGDAADLRRTSLTLGLQAGLLVVGCLLVVGALLFVVYERAADSAANQLLSDTTSNIDSANEAPPGVMVVVVTSQGRRSISTSMPDGLPDEGQLTATAKDGRTRQVDLDRGGDSYTVRTANVGGRVTQAILDRHETAEERGRILTALLVAGVVGVLLAVLVAAWLARRTVRPMAETIAMQRRFVADASHELRTPLTLLSTRAQLLSRRLHKEPRAAPDVVADVDGVVAETKTLTDILDELLTAADTRGREQWAAVDIGAVVQEVAAAATAAAEQAEVTLRVVDCASAGRVNGSRASLRRALTALVDNAVGHASSSVTIAARARRRHVEVEVSDDGPGIPKDLAPRLFDRFSGLRSEAATVDGRRHYGLGLALVADVAANHHGRVTVADRKDGSTGAVFTLTLPTHG